MSDQLLTTIQHLAGFLVAIIGLVTTILNLRRSRTVPIVVQTAEQSSEVSRKRVIQLNDPQQLVDLAMTFIFASLFSLLLTYSLIISGKGVTWGILTISSLGITCLITGILFYAWMRYQFEFALFTLSIISIVTLIIAPAGPLSRSSEVGEESLPDTFPLFVLVVMISALAIYLYGNPFVERYATKRRIIVGILLIGLAIFPSIIAGISFVNSVFSEDPALKLIKPESSAILSYLRTRPLESGEKQHFYRLASEHALLPYYRQQQNVLGANTGREVTPPEPKDQSVQIPPSQRNLQNQETEISPSFQDIIAKALKKFEITTDPATYMLNRTLWVHPLGGRKGTKAKIPHPGNNAQERLKKTAVYRIVHVFNEQPRLRRQWLESEQFFYPEEVRDVLSKDKEKGNLLQDLGLDIGFGRKPSLLPEFLPHPGNALLKQQLALPVEQESLVAFTQYRKIKSSNLKDKQILDLLDKFDKLANDTKDAFIFYIMNESSFGKYEVLRELYPLQDSLKKDSYDPDAGPGQLQNLIQTESAPAPRATEPSGQEQDPVVVLASLIKERLQLIHSPAIKDKILRELQELLRSNNYKSASVINLFKKEALAFVKQNQDTGLSDEGRRQLFEICSDPIWPAVIEMANKVVFENETRKDDFIKYLRAFRSLPQDEKEALLNLLSYDLYQAEPDSFVKVILAKAKTYGYNFDILLGSVFLFPFFFLGILWGSRIARKMRERNNIRQLIYAEKEEQQNLESAFDTGPSLLGREEILEQLRNLTRKGWSTIALVGRRGVGKSRILHQILRGNPNGSHRPQIGLWITSPAKYEEKDFIANVLERLAEETERAVSVRMGADPLAVRMLEARVKPLYLITYGLLSLVLFILISTVGSQLSEPMLILTLVPVYLTALISAVAMIAYYYKVQPVNLMSWLETSTKEPQAVLLYKETMGVFHFLHESGRKTLEEYTLGLRKALLLSLAVLFFIFLLVFLVYTSFTWFLVLLVIGGGWLLVFTRRPKQTIGSDRGLMLLVTKYREYVRTVVRRIELGALGSMSSAPGLVICIDELDKIVELDEVRDFVRRIKGIFEVPGVFYYLSLAEDSFVSLSLGSVEGKNEIDSSFDHIVRIRPLPCVNSTEVVQAYLEKLKTRDYHERLARTIAAASFGIPRDILRLCDEVSANTEGTLKANPDRLVRNNRYLQIDLNYELHRISIDLKMGLKSAPKQCAAFAESVIAKGFPDNNCLGTYNLRAIVATWLLALLELSVSIEDQVVWVDTTETISDIGSQLSIYPIEDILPEVQKLHELLVSVP